MKLIPHIAAGLCFLLLAGCSQGPKSSFGFTLPDGDAAAGKQTFVSYMCHECHSVSGMEMPDVEFAAERQVKLGGKVDRIQTYGELVTSIINPSHKLASGYRPEDVSAEGESKMTNYNDVMTVGELIDIVAFLQAQYELKPFEPTAYDMYYYGP
ncbi:MAG: c-type cytochrome [Fuerstiella sp.]